MSKVVKFVGKVAGVVAGVALIATGVGAALGGTMLFTAFGASIAASTIATVAGAVAMGASLLQKRPKAPEPSRENFDRLNASIDPRTPRKIVLGSTAMATDIRDQEYSNNQDYLHRFVVVAAHKVAAINQIWFDDKLAWTSAGGAQGDYAGYLTVQTRLEGNASNAINIGPRMGLSRRYTGCAYVYIRYKMTGNSKKAQSPFASGIPSRMTIRGNGAFIYDPRRDSSVGGSGTQRANDQSTWTWDANASRNPALQLLWYLLGWRINGVLSVGCGIPASRIDMQSFITAANLCDEPVALVSGGTEPRYRSDGVFGTGDAPTNVTDNIKAAMNADLDDVGGQLRVTVFHNDLAAPVAHFDEDDFAGGFNWAQTPSLVDSFNVVRGTFTNPSDQSLYQMVDYPEVWLPSRDGIERIDSFDLAMVQSPSQAQRLAKQRLQRQQYGGEFETTFMARGWLVQKNSVISLSLNVLGWTNKLFRVAEMEHRVDGTCPIRLREESSDIYQWDKSESPAVNPADPTVYDYTLDPFYQGLEEAGSGTNVIWIKSAVPPATPAPSVGVPADWYENSTDLPTGDAPIWVSYGKRVGAAFEWQAPILSATDTRYWDAIDQDGKINPDRVDGDAIVDGGVGTPNIVGGGVTANQIITASDTFVFSSDTNKVFLETGWITVGDSVYSSSLIDLNFVHDAGWTQGEYDAAVLYRLFIDIGAGWTQVRYQNIGTSSISGSTYSMNCVTLQTFVQDIATFRIRATATPSDVMRASIKRNTYTRNTVLSILGAKR